MEITDSLLGLENIEAEERNRASAEAASQAEAFGRVAVGLLQGVLERYRDETLWQDLLKQRNGLEDYFSRIGLRLIVQELDEYAYLQQLDESGLPHLVSRHQLSYGLSLLLVELRKALGEMNSADGQRLLVDAAEMSVQMEPFFPPAGNDQKFRQQVEGLLRQAERMGFLREMPGAKNGQICYEVRPLLRSFVDGQWLADFARRLKDFEEYGRQRQIEAGAEGDAAAGLAAAYALEDRV